MRRGRPSRDHRRWGLRAVGALVMAGALGAAAASATGSELSRTVRIGQAPRVAHTARVIGAVAASTRMHLTIALRPRDPSALAAYATAVATPGSAAYRDYLTTAQFAARFGASPAALSAVSASMRAHGLTPVAVSSNHLSIQLAGSAAQVERAFRLSFTRMALASGRKAVVASAAPALDRGIAGDVEDVIGLTSVSAPHPLYQRPSILRPAARALTSARGRPHVVTGGPQPCAAASSAASSQGAYTADQIASAYQFSSLYGAGAQGRGVTVAVYELEPNDPNDIATYQACYGTTVPVSYVQVDGGAGSGPGVGEAALDIEQVIGLAPQASVLVYQGPNSNSGSAGSGPYDTLNRIVTDNRAQVVSVSWGGCEQLQSSGTLQDENTLFQEAAAQGQSMVSAAGDSGSEDCNQANNLPDPSLAVDDPGSQQFVTAVGGTTLSAAGPPASEKAWNNGGNPTSLLGLQGGAGGGGVSQAWAMPSYQSGAPGSLHLISSNSSGGACGNTAGYCRQVPDVAASSDPSAGYIVYTNGSNTAGVGQPSGWQAIGGTSAAAPLWAALLADVNSSSACHGSRVGFANPALYHAAAVGYSSYFTDVTSGNNDFTGTNGGLYPAGAGYDMATGLGTPNAAALAVGLCADALQVNNPGTQTSTLGQPVNVQLTTNVSAGAKLNFAATYVPLGLSISRSTGRVTGKPKHLGTSTVTVSATDGTLPVRAATFTWKIVGPPTVSGLSLVNVASGHPKLALTITAGSAAPQLISVTLGLPQGLSFGRPGRGVVVSSGGRRTAFAARVLGGRLQLTLARPTQRIAITLSGTAVKASGGLVARARRHAAGSLTVSVQTTDTNQQAVATSARTKPRS